MPKENAKKEHENVTSISVGLLESAKTVVERERKKRATEGEKKSARNQKAAYRKEEPDNSPAKENGTCREQST